MKKLLLILPLLLMIVFSACTAKNQETETAPDEPVAGEEATVLLEGKTWELMSMIDESGEEIPPEGIITAKFEEGQLSGNSGCNSYGTSYELSENNAITIDPMMMGTMMACPEPLMGQEQMYRENLGQASTYEVSEATLFLKDENGEIVLSFLPQKALSLTGTEWQLVSYNNGKEAVVSVIIGTEITATFSEEGKVGGSSGCNSYNATYEIDGQSIDFGPAMSTQMYCEEPKGTMDQEMGYLKALENSNQYMIEGNTLKMTDENGARQAVYSAAE